MTADRDLERLIDIVASGIRILRTRDGVAVTDAQCLERARNIVSAVVVTFELRALPAILEFRGDRNAPEGSWIGLSSAPDWRTPLISNGNYITPGQLKLISDAPRHMFGCRCGKCPGEWMPVLDGLRTERPAGVVSYHGWSCMCSTCADAKQKERS